jgi:hypothetical protein
MKLRLVAGQKANEKEMRIEVLKMASIVAVFGLI